jgi:hypothetical protein
MYRLTLTPQRLCDAVGWFEDEPVNIETLAARAGESLQRVAVTSKDAATAVGGPATAPGSVPSIVRHETEGAIECFPEADLRGVSAEPLAHK